MEGHLVSIGLSIAGPALLGIFGFLWKVSSRLTAAEKHIEAMDRRITKNSVQLQSHFEKAFTIRKTID